MKKIFLLLPVVFFSLLSAAQCDKTVTFKCYKGREIKHGSAGQEMPVEVITSIDKGKINITLTMDRGTATMQGEITEVVTCEWSEYLQNGKTQYKATVSKDGGAMEAALIEIESYNGQTKITFGSDPDTGSKLQLDVVDYTIVEDKRVAPKTNEPVKRKKRSKN
jgi:hypothetical protein